MSDTSQRDGATQTVTEPSEESPSEYAHLRTKRAEREGNVEEAIVEDVFVGREAVNLTISFEWTDRTERVRYDLEDDRDVLKLEALTEAQGFDFEQVGHMENTAVEVVYADGEWVPTAHEGVMEDRGSVTETFLTELRLLGREIARLPRVLRRSIRTVRTLSTKQLLIGVVLLKKIVIVAAIVYLIL